MLKSPVVLLTFANGDDDHPLDLKKESSMLKDAFLLLEHEGLVNVEREESVTLEEVEKRLRNYYNDLVIFHYAGHANSTKLLFEGGAVGGNGIAGMLGQAPHLQLVFLNACETREQADVFLDAGVNAVVATLRPINDARAIQFSRVFYESISRKATIQEAFDRAKAFVEVADAAGGNRSLMAALNDDGSEDVPPWQLYSREARLLSWKIDQDVKIFLNLRMGSRAFFTKLLAGPLVHHRNLIERQNPNPEADELFVTVTTDGAQDQLLPDALKSLWQEETPHAWLYGGPGTGKTGSVLLMWNRLLHQTSTNGNAPVPIFVDLEDYTDQDRTYILSFISKYYLEVGGFSEHNEQEAIWNIAKQPNFDVEGRQKIPAIILFLDGEFQEGTTLDREIKELARQPGVQIVCTTNAPDQAERKKMGFHFLEIKPLEDEEIKAKIQDELTKFRPEIRTLVSSNRLWLNLFHELYSNIDVAAGKEEKAYEFIEDFTTPGEFLWNYFEARLFTQTNDILNPDSKRSALRFNRFFLRHFIPKMVYEIEMDGNYEVVEDQLLEIINEISHFFYQPWFLKVFPDYRREFKNFFLEAEGWVAESERLAVLIDICKDFSIFTEGFKTYSVNQPGKEFLHLHKVRTYKISNNYFLSFLAALHVWQDIKAGLFAGTFPTSLKERKLSCDVLVMLGELDGIHRNSDDQVLLMLLHRCRGIFDQKVLGYTVWNILQVWNETKGSYMGLSLARLDLRGIPLHRLSKELTYEPYFLSSDLSGSLVNYKDIFRTKGGHVVDFRYSKDGQVIVTGECDGTIRQWDTELMICYKIIEGHIDKVNAVCMTETVQYLISGSEDGTIRFWDQQTEECLLTLECPESHNGPILSLAYQPIPDAPEGVFWLVSSGQDTYINFWRIDLTLRVAEKIQQMPFHQDAVKSVDFFVGSRKEVAEEVENREHLQYHITVIAGSWDNSVTFWDDEFRYPKSVLDKHVSRVHCVKFSENGEYFASGSSDDTVIVYRTENPNHYQRRLKGHNRGIESLEFKEIEDEFGNKETHLVSAASGDKIMVWNISEIDWDVNHLNLLAHPATESGRNPHELSTWVLPLGYGKEVNCIAFSPKYDRIAYATSDGRLRIWNLLNDSFYEEAILYNIYELHVQGCKFIDLHEKSNLFEMETAFIKEDDGEKEVTKEMLLRQYGAIMNETDEANWGLIVEKMRRR